MRPVEMRGDLGQGDVWPLVDQGQNFVGMGLHPVRMGIAPAGLRLDMALLAPPIEPLDGR